MNEVKKIFVEKEEGVASLVERLRAEADAEVVFVIPKHSSLRRSVNNFRVLKREADALGKTVSVESVDVEILRLAHAARLEANHPLLKPAEGGRMLFDIVPGGAGERKKGSDEKKVTRGARRAPEAEEFPAEDASVPEEIVPVEGEKRPQKARRRVSARAIFLVALAVLLVGGALWAASTVFARARVTISFKKSPWHYEGTVTASKAAVKVNATAASVPGEVFQQEKNVTQLFPASGKSRVSEKAKGKLTIFNAYSSQSQTLVAATRFVTPEGKVFRLDNQVIVPGAEIKDGKVSPASTETMVTADAAGEEYNVGPVARLTIPGFKGTPKYDGFYGALAGGTSGGFVGEKPVPTEKDIEAAKEKVAAVVRAGLEASALRVPSEFTLIEGASETKVTRLTVNKSTDQSGNFSAFGEARFRGVGFREKDVVSLLLGSVERDYPETAMVLQNLKLTYRSTKVNIDRGELTFSLTAEGVAAPAFAADDLKEKIAGQEVKHAQLLVSALPGLAEAKITLWPFWLARVPGVPRRVEVVAN